MPWQEISDRLASTATDTKGEFVVIARDRWSIIQNHRDYRRAVQAPVYSHCGM
jgi:hypothetical protein